MIILELMFFGTFGFIGFFLFLMWWAAKRNEKARQERVRQAYNFDPPQTHGSARYADDRDLRKAGYFKSRGIRIGFSPEGKRLFFNKAGNLLVVAGARAGKALTILVEAILTLPKSFSLCVFDPKGELCAITGHGRKRAGNVYVLNPSQIMLAAAMVGLDQACFNPLASLDPCSVGFHSGCDRVADAVCWEDGGENHFIISARQIISGTIAVLVKYGAPEEKNLVAVRNVITGASGRSFNEFCRECMALPDIYIRQKLARFAAPDAKENKELQSIISTADTQTGFISGAIAESLKKSDFAWSDLRRKPGTTVYICLPLHELPVSRKYFRLLASSLISDILADALKNPKGAQVLGVLDEIFQIGPLKILSDAWAMAAGAAGLKLMGIYQDYSQIRSQMNSAASTLIANSAVAIFFGIRDQETADLVSKSCGIGDVTSHSRSVSIDVRSGEPIVNDSATLQARPLLQPDEVRFGLGPDEMLLFGDGLPGVCRAKRKPYFRVRGLKGYRPNPYYQKPPGFLSRLLSWLFT